MPGVLIQRAPYGLYGRLFLPGHREVLKPAQKRIEGWLAFSGGRIGELHVKCDETVLGTTHRFMPLRPADDLPVPGSLRSGVLRWACETELSRLADGEQRLDIEVELPKLGWVVLDSVCVMVSRSDDGGRPLGGFTNLSEGVTAPRGPIMVTGEAVHAAAPVRAVVLNIGRLPVARALVDRRSPDAAKRWPTLPWAANAGWQVEIDLSLAEDMTAQLSVDALIPGDEWVRLDTAKIRIQDRQ